MVFVNFWRYFKVIFEALNDKREMELRKANNVDDEEEEMHLDQALELIWRCLRWIQKKEMEEMLKKKLKNYVFPFRMIMQKFGTVMRNRPEGICAANQRKISKLISHDHANISNSHAKCSMKAKIGADAFFTSHNHAKLLDLMQNGHFITKLQISW